AWARPPATRTCTTRAWRTRRPDGSKRGSARRAARWGTRSTTWRTRSKTRVLRAQCRVPGLRYPVLGAEPDQCEGYRGDGRIDQHAAIADRAIPRRVAEQARAEVRRQRERHRRTGGPLVDEPARVAHRQQKQRGSGEPVFGNAGVRGRQAADDGVCDRPSAE